MNIAGTPGYNRKSALHIVVGLFYITNFNLHFYVLQRGNNKQISTQSNI